MSPADLAPDLSREAPRSPRLRLRGYVLLGRILDKCRASLAENPGPYQFNCPLDNRLFRFKNVSAEAFQQQVQSGAGDQEMALWIDTHGVPRTPQEVEAWSNALEMNRPYNDPALRTWFVKECQSLRLDPQTTTLFDWLEADDLATFPS